MTELRDLKDIKWFEEDSPHHKNIIRSFKEELKAEAMKWEKKEKSEDVKLWIIEFFNLTEEDLQEKEDE